MSQAAKQAEDPIKLPKDPKGKANKCWATD